MLNVVMLSVISQCQDFFAMLNVVELNVVMLSVVMPNVAMLSAVIPNVVMLSVISQFQDFLSLS
jgi:hypothetical protein